MEKQLLHIDRAKLEDLLDIYDIEGNCHTHPWSMDSLKREFDLEFSFFL